MKLRFRSILSFILCLFLCLSLLSATVLAVDGRNIIALGDSISTGYGLASPATECFVHRIANPEDTVTNLAINGNTAAGILSQLTDAQHTLPVTAAQLQAAELVTITCGGNDLMALLYRKIAELWNARNPDNPIAASEVIGKLENKDTGLMMIALELLKRNNEAYLIADPDFQTELNNYIANLNRVTTHIHSVNPDADIIVATQYNPYVEFQGASINMAFISIDLDPIYSGMEDGVTRLNTAIRNNASTGGYYVAEVKAAFDAYTGSGDLYNANPSANAMNVDFHPAAAGHQVLAQTFRAVIDTLPPKVEVGPSAPRNLTAKWNADETITLTWEAPADSGDADVTQYVIEYGAHTNGIDGPKDADALWDSEAGVYTYTYRPTGSTIIADYTFYVGALNGAHDYETGADNSDGVAYAVYTNRLTALALTAQPDLTYAAGDVLNLSALKLTATYTDGSRILSYNSPGVTTTMTHGTALQGSDHGKTITVSFGGKTVETSAITHTARTAGEYNIDAIRLLDSNSEILSEIPVGSCLAAVSVTNHSSAGDVMVLLAAYSAAGQYQGLMWGRVTGTAVGNTATLTLTVNNASGQIAQFRAFPVAAFADFQPLGSVAVFPTP